MRIYTRIFIICCCFFALVSCKKDNSIIATDSLDAGWIKILPDSTILCSAKTRYDIIASSDGGVYVPILGQDYNFRILKFDKDGNLIWQTTRPPLLIDFYEEYNEISLLELPDQSLIVCGKDLAFDPNTNLLLYRFTKDGILLDSASIDIKLNSGSLGFGIYDVQLFLQNNNTIFIYGSYSGPQSFRVDLYTCRIDFDLNKIENHKFQIPVTTGFLNLIKPRGIIVTNNNELLIAGHYEAQSSDYSSKFGLFTALVNQFGEKIATHYYQTGDWPYGYPLEGYIPRSGKLFRDASGNIITWTTPLYNPSSGINYENEDKRQHFIQYTETGLLADTIHWSTSPLHYLISGVLKDDGSFLFAADVVYPVTSFINRTLSNVVTVNENGTVNGISKIQSLVRTQLTSICKTKDGGFVLSGYIQRVGSDVNQLVLIKIGKDGIL